MATSLLKISSPKSKSSPKNSKSFESSKGDSYEIEFLEYEWPDLPPLTQVRDAITRNKISRGISYLLPLDPISSNFKPDLRAMFTKTNRSYDSSLFESSKTRPTAKTRYFTNSIDITWADKNIRKSSPKLNSDSEKVRKLYGRSAPSQTSAKRRMGLDASKSRQRSSVHIQIKANEPPEAVQIRAEVDNIIKELKEDEGDFDIGQECGQNKDSDLSNMMKSSPLNRKESIFKEDSSLLSDKMESLRLSQRKFTNYQKLKQAEPPKLVIPEPLRSSYLSDESNQHIWEWLHNGEKMTDFDFFLSVCG